MESYDYLLTLAIILLATKVFGLLTEHEHLPQVVGALLAGVVLGPSCLGIVEQTDFLLKTADIGVVLMIFIAGLDTDFEQLKHTGKTALVVAVLGVFVPLVGCAAVYFLFFEHGVEFMSLMRSAFIGVVFTATSVSITVETLQEMGKLKTDVGATLLNAAIIDDVIGIVVLSVVCGLADGSGAPAAVLGKIALYFVFVLLVGSLALWFFRSLSQEHWHSRRIAIWAVAFCFLMAYAAEKFFGVAEITGAYFAGLILCNVSKARQFVAKKITVASYLVFSPVFFASVGIKTDLRMMNRDILLFALVLLVMAVAAKVLGCGLGARLCGMEKRDSLAVGCGMAARGEVALMVAQKGIDAGFIRPTIFPAVVMVTICAALVTPILLKLSLREKA